MRRGWTLAAVLSAAALTFPMAARADSWVGAGTLGTGRYSAAAAKLQDGSVLLIGGRTTSQVLRSGPIPNTQVRPVLYSLLRHGLLSTYSFVTGSLLQRAGFALPVRD